MGLPRHAPGVELTKTADVTTVTTALSHSLSLITYQAGSKEEVVTTKRWMESRPSSRIFLAVREKSKALPASCLVPGRDR